ncbi:hypothetical protein ACFSSC_06790 [Corynebacterium mendelii]|uniref:hypothetical protein n=1 Tax=Corynebacterium mendelii TaxID=2765362 RepID=UPI00363A2697
MAAQDQKRLEAFAKTHGAVRYSSLIERIIAAVKAQKIAMPGTKQLIIGITINAHQILELKPPTRGSPP